jgi:RNA polymerase sigma factor (sigma-70 family)
MSKDVIHNWLKITGSEAVLPQEKLDRLALIIQDPHTPSATKRKALDKLVKCNTKMVVHVTLKFFRNRFNVKLTDDRINDYLQQGMLGLIKAAEKFDPSKGYKFSTYAYRWIRSYLGRYHYANHSLVHIPEPVLCAMLSGNNVEKQKHLIQDARRFLDMESLDKIVFNRATGDSCSLVDAIPDPKTALVY